MLSSSACPAAASVGSTLGDHLIFRCRMWPLEELNFRYGVTPPMVSCLALKLRDAFAAGRALTSGEDDGCTSNDALTLATVAKIQFSSSSACNDEAIGALDGPIM